MNNSRKKWKMSERAAPPFPLLPSVKKTFCAKRAAGCSPSLGENLFGLWMSNGLGWFGDFGRREGWRESWEESQQSRACGGVSQTALLALYLWLRVPVAVAI
jgi:hypothetical protein